MRPLRWSAVGLALVAFWLPALRGSVVLLGSEQWSLVALADGHSDINRLVNQAPALQSLFDVQRGAQWLTVAQALPKLALAAGLCVLFCVLFEVLGRGRWAIVAAAIGLVITIGLCGAAEWLTHAAHARITLDVEPGLYLLGLALLALLIAPGTGRKAQ
ncbi:MAG TPA: hypothetical protein VN709_13285 [Terriglobales bacterium]|nr:hypothetical protein [Terriglobales bacterium]